MENNLNNDQKIFLVIPATRSSLRIGFTFKHQKRVKNELKFYKNVLIRFIWYFFYKKLFFTRKNHIKYYFPEGINFSASSLRIGFTFCCQKRVFSKNKRLNLGEKPKMTKKMFFTGQHI